VAIVGALLAAIAALSMLSTPGLKRLAPGAYRVRPAPTIRSSPAPVDRRPPDAKPVIDHGLSHLLSNIVVYGFGVIVGLVVLWLIWYLIKGLGSPQRSHRQAADSSGMNRRDQVLAAVDESIAELARDDTDPRAAVIMCWVRLEEVAAVAGTERAPGDTSSELVQRLLGDHQVSSSVLMSLADLYRRARYSSQIIETSMRADAREALSRLRDELRYSRSGPLADEPVHAPPVEVRRPRPSARSAAKR
jgi:hypothetical protein